MACKMRCPECGRVLKEQGDESKSAQGEYLIVEKDVRHLRCLACGHESTVKHWSDEDDKWMRAKYGNPQAAS